MKNKYPNPKLQYNWIWYAVVLCVAVVWWVLAFQMYHIPPASEQVTIFVTGEVTDRTLAQTLEDAYDIRLVEVYSSKKEASEFQTKYSVVGLNSSYILLIPKDVAEKTYCAESFVSLEEMGLVCENAFQQKDEQTGEVLAFGVPADPQILARHFKTDGEYYLFVGGKGVDENGKLHPHTLEVLRYFWGQ